MDITYSVVILVIISIIYHGIRFDAELVKNAKNENENPLSIVKLTLSYNKHVYQKYTQQWHGIDHVMNIVCGGGQAIPNHSNKG